MRRCAAGCEFQVVEAPLEEPFLGYYRASARMWNQLRREFLYAAEQVASSAHASSVSDAGERLHTLTPAQ